MKHVQLFTSTLEGKREWNSYEGICWKDSLYLKLVRYRNLCEPTQVSEINDVTFAICLGPCQITQQLQTIIFITGRLTSQSVAVDTDLHRTRLKHPPRLGRLEFGQHRGGLRLKRLKGLNVVVQRVVPVGELGHVLD